MEGPRNPFGEDVHLLLEKTGHYEDSNEDGEFSAGDTVFYSFLIKNVCTGTIDQISVQDPLATVEGEPITLSPGEENGTAFSAYHVLSQEDVDAGEFKNKATVSGKLPSGEVTTAEDEDIQDIYVKGSIKLEKTGTYEDTNGDGVPNVGDHVHYSFVVKNSCHATLYDVVVVDPLVEVSGGPVMLAPGEKDRTTFTGTYALTQTDIDAGTLVNTATATGRNSHGEVILDKDEDTQFFEVSGAVKLKKVGEYQDSNGDGYASPGDQILYTFEVKNSCHVTLKNVHIVDPLVAVSGGPITLAPGEKDKTTFKAIYTITQEDVDRGKVVNEATATGENPQGEPITDCDTYTVLLEGPDQTVMFELTKTVDVTQAVLGQQLTYTISITNTSQIEVKDITVTDHLPGELTLISSSLEQEVGGGWSIASMEPDEQLVIEIVVMATQVGEAVNVVELTVGDCRVEAEAEAVIITDRNVDMVISKTSEAAKIYQGDEFTYTIIVQNTGEGQATEVLIVDQLPELVSYVGSSYLLSTKEIEPQLSQEGNTLRWIIAEFPAGASMAITLTVKANMLGDLLNEVSVESAQEDVNPADNTDSDVNTIAEFFIPNVFTPGTKDNINDYFMIRELQQFTRNRIVIMNRLGDHVFEKENYQNDWDAEGLNGGAYFYVLQVTDAQGDPHVFKGWVQVIKSTTSSQTER
ncbi:hypothetical protein GCM10011339_22510 [Echinicola rosea]|uniref:DUF11 domain-containing protein n=1 Tax=Echinicola rosea TaxID=1807691 RepID=A0ABQ1V131_9BACT|nr:hypothetical protein GCM10011339_22510 [Echinicola rosea]